jgi:hypothetical protein
VVDEDRVGVVLVQAPVERGLEAVGGRDRRRGVALAMQWTTRVTSMPAAVSASAVRCAWRAPSSDRTS